MKGVRQVQADRAQLGFPQNKEEELENLFKTTRTRILARTKSHSKSRGLESLLDFRRAASPVGEHMLCIQKVRDQALAPSDRAGKGLGPKVAACQCKQR